LRDQAKRPDPNLDPTRKPRRPELEPPKSDRVSQPVILIPQAFQIPSSRALSPVGERES
jgi:hypothetical protein